MRQGTAQKFVDKPAARAADHNLGDILEFGKPQQFGRQIAAGQCLRLGAEAHRQLHGLIQALSRRIVEDCSRPLHCDGNPRRVH
jgi:hypothetical protein